MNEKDFTRQRSLPLPVLITLLLNLRKGSNEDELNRFFGILTDQPLADSVTPSALSQARKKLKPRALMGLSSQLVTSSRHHFAERRWHGLRLLAVDGSTARLPNTPDVIETFGEPPAGSFIPLARFSRLYDVLNGLAIEADIEPRSVGERVLAGEHLAATGADDLLLYDRGYPAFWLFALHQQEQRHFCARLSLSFSAEVERFLAGGGKSGWSPLNRGPKPRNSARCSDSLTIPCACA